MSQVAPTSNATPLALSPERQVPQSSTGQRYPAVKGYHLTRLLGGGGFSRVYKAVNSEVRPSEAACKVVSYAPISPGSSGPRHAANPQALQKEVQIHAILKHIHVLRFLGVDEFGTKSRPAGGYVPGLYMLLEYAAGGDLFDKIAPDVGVSEDLAQFYFRQLIAGLEYIHEQGIVHRDIKPENLLLSADGDLKIADFGLCSVYRYKGKERVLKGACGSLPYVAPEMNATPYKGEGVDVWSAGVVLFALLVGNTPWDEPTTHAPEYNAYVRGQLLKYQPWCNIPEKPLDLLLSMLNPDSKKRETLSQIRKHSWFVRPNPLLEQPTSKEEQTGTLVEALMSSLVRGGNLPLAIDLHSDGQRADPVAHPAASQPSALSSHYRPDGGDAMDVDTEPAPLPLPPASMTIVGHHSLSQAAVEAAMTQLGARRRATLTQNPSATQFQALWQGMTQWTEVAGTGARFSTQTTRFFSAREPWQVIPAIMRVLGRHMAQTKVYALDTRSSDNDGDANTDVGLSDRQTRIDLQHQADMDSLVAGMHALTPDSNQAQFSKEELVWRQLLNARASSSPSPSSRLSPSPHRNRGARIMVTLSDRRKCRLLGNIWVDPLRPRRQHTSIKSLVLFDRSSGSPLEWRRLFKSVLDDTDISHSLVFM